MIALALLVLQPQQLTDKDCDQPRNQLEINVCSYRLYQSEDAKLNRQWKRTLERVRAHPEEQIPGLHGGKKDEQLLIEAQRAWIAYRDAQCAFEETYMPGSGGPSMRFGCLASLTAERTKQLREMAGN